MNLLAILSTLAFGAGGAYFGWWVGLLLCPDPGEIGMGAIGWCIGGAVAGGVTGVVTGMALLG